MRGDHSDMRERQPSPSGADALQGHRGVGAGVGLLVLGGAKQGGDSGGRGGTESGQRQGGVVAHAAVRVRQECAERWTRRRLSPNPGNRVPRPRCGRTQATRRSGHRGSRGAVSLAAWPMSPSTSAAAARTHHASSSSSAATADTAGAPTADRANTASSWLGLVWSASRLRSRNDPAWRRSVATRHGTASPPRLARA